MSEDIYKAARARREVEKALPDSAVASWMARMGPHKGRTALRQQIGPHTPNPRRPKNFGVRPSRGTASINADKNLPALAGRKNVLPARPGIDPEGTAATLRNNTKQGPRSLSDRRQDWSDQLKRVASTDNGRAPGAMQAGEQRVRWAAGEERRTALRLRNQQERATSPFATRSKLADSPRVAAAARARREAAAAAAPAKKKRSWFGR